MPAHRTRRSTTSRPRGPSSLRSGRINVAMPTAAAPPSCDARSPTISASSGWTPTASNASVNIRGVRLLEPVLERQHPRIDELRDPVLGEVDAQIEVDVADQRDPHAAGPQGGEHLGDVRIQRMARRVEVEAIPRLNQLAVE